MCLLKYFCKIISYFRCIDRLEIVLYLFIYLFKRYMFFNMCNNDFDIEEGIRYCFYKICYNGKWDVYIIIYKIK